MINKILKRRIKICIIFIASGTIFFLASFNSGTENTFDKSFKRYFSDHSSLLLNDVNLLFNEVDKKDFNIDSAKALLSDARREYKSIEAFISYFFPGDQRRLNRVIIMEMDEDDEISAYVVPHGFQYIEKLLYNDSVRFFGKKIKNEVNEIYVVIGRFNESVSYIDVNERDVYEAMQMQLIRQFMLGFANFETSLSRDGVTESLATLDFYKEFIQRTYPQPDSKNFKTFSDFYKAVNNAIKFLSTVKPKSEPDYFTFYSKYYIPVSEQLGHVREMNTSNNLYNTSAINYQIRSVFDPHSFNSFFFLPEKNVASPEAVIELGRTLFFDPALSANNLRACASCHQAGKCFTDGLPLSQSFEPGKMLLRNAPTIVNAVFQRKLFHDGRAFTFEGQAGQVMSNPLEMHNDFSQVAVKLRTSPDYVKWFRNAFAGYDDTLISSSSILTAIAEYERSVIGMNSRFDKTISGRDELMDADEKEGFNLFMGKGNCASCHFLPLFNGTMPPEYVETEWEIIGVPSAKISVKRELDPDIGRAGVVNVDIFRHAFKVPTVRNAELTSPYMHNGVFKSLEEVVEFYNVGGGTGLGYEVPFQTLPPDSLFFTAQEKFQLISFLKTLTDTVNITSRPTKLPDFPGIPKLNSRPIGGDY